MAGVEFSDMRKGIPQGTFPARWGPVPHNAELRARWIRHNVETEQRNRANGTGPMDGRKLARMRAQLMATRYPLSTITVSGRRL